MSKQQSAPGSGSLVRLEVQAASNGYIVREFHVFGAHTRVASDEKELMKALKESVAHFSGAGALGELAGIPFPVPGSGPGIFGSLKFEDIASRGLKEVGSFLGVDVEKYIPAIQKLCRKAFEESLDQILEKASAEE